MMRVVNGLPTGTALLIRAMLHMAAERRAPYVTFRLERWARSFAFLADQYGGSWQRPRGYEFRYRLTGEQTAAWMAALLAWVQGVKN